MEALAAVYWFMVISSIPAMFVIGCVYTYRAIAPRPPLVAIPRATVQHGSASMTARALGAWTGRTATTLVRIAIPTAAGFGTVALGVLLAVGIYGMVF